MALNEINRDDDDRQESQHDPHNKRPNEAKKIRMSWIIIALLFTALALTAVFIAYR